MAIKIGNIMKRIIIWGIVFVASLYLGVMLFLYTNQRNMQYINNGEVISLEQAQMERTQIISVPILKSAPSLVVRGWYAPPIDDKPIILYFNGNEGSFTQQYERLREIVKDGYGLVAFDYRGYPMSLGKVNEENILSDSLAVFDWASEKGKPIILFGRSLGSGPATYVASKRKAQALVLETPFLSAVKVAQERYPILPVSSLLKDKYLSNEWIKQVEEPLFIAHGTKDKVIPVHHGKELFSLANNGQKLWIVEGATHGDLWQHGLWQQIKEFLAKL